MEKEAYVIGDDSKSSNPLDSEFTVSSQPTMADISEGVDTIKDNWEFDDEMSEEKGTMDGNKGKTEESANDEEKDTMDGNKEPIEAHDTTDNPETGGYSLLGVGGNRNENQKDRTDIITGSSIESTEKDENGSASLVTKTVLNTHDESSDEDEMMTMIMRIKMIIMIMLMMTEVTIMICQVCKKIMNRL